MLKQDTFDGDNNHVKKATINQDVKLKLDLKIVDQSSFWKSWQMPPRPLHKYDTSINIGDVRVKNNKSLNFIHKNADQSATLE